MSGCGAFTGDSFYAEQFPAAIQCVQHPIAHLELLNVVVAMRVWGDRWRGHTVDVQCDNMNACLAVQSGRSRDSFVQHCVRELFVMGVAFDIELRVVHCPGKDLTRADALSRMHMDHRCRRWVEADSQLRGATRVRVPEEMFVLSVGV